MASSIVGSFVEVYKTSVGQSKKQLLRAAATAAAEAPSRDIFEAARRGDLDYLHHRVAEEADAAANLLASRDDAGHTAAHWASLNYRLGVLDFIASQDPGLCNLTSSHELGQRPIHWASVNGHVTIIEFLLDRCGASIDQRDEKGATPLLVACQYGQTVAAIYLMSRGAAIAAFDLEGDTAMHWAAFKGQADLMRLLVYAGCQPEAKDVYGQTPLHFACIGGSLAIVRDLCFVDKVAINVADNNGRTPIQLAAGRRHLEIEHFLNKQQRSQSSMLGEELNWSHLLFGPPGNTRCPLLFFLITVGVWGYSNYIVRGFPLTIEQYPGMNYLFICFNALMWICFYHTNLSDPGYLARNQPEYDQAIKLAGSGSSQLERLCHTCRAVKPLRSKHCKICNRCVSHMDHHCPYVYNCVGANNRHSFLLFVTFCVLSGVISLNLIWIVWNIEGRPYRWDYMIGVPLQALFGIMLIIINRYGWYNAAKNITTNELMNMQRYKYLQDAQGKFWNPFDRGVARNFLEFFHLKPQWDYDELLKVKEPMPV
ncbi:hypothetical protein BOX15_Mlig002723g4 [Macrostomum lignano]|nr:hypothetical protein BOX15_Mlig002723g2 [Macrostomum lignano]PAA83226.1 hypothetical protein BOX15_Mlig002723g4 [Macrostomum lignano]